MDQSHERRDTVAVWLTVQGRGSVGELISALATIDGVVGVSADDPNSPSI